MVFGLLPLISVCDANNEAVEGLNDRTVAAPTFVCPSILFWNCCLKSVMVNELFSVS